ncbi:MAG: glycoside hydrolase family 28 protein [Prevotella sp.]|nr:glycoside hydrolase family 28 protein [Prevotella sp.]
MKRLFALFSLLGVLATMPAKAADYASLYQALPCQVKAVEPFSLPDNEVSIADCGAVGDGLTLCTEAFEKAISRLSKQGGGRVVVPEGVWLTGPIMLKDNIELHLQQGALLCFSPDKRLYLDKNASAKRVYPCIRASKRRNIAITGRGVIDGGGQQWRPVKRVKMSDVEWKQYQDMGGQLTADGQLWYPWQLSSGYPDIADTPQKQESMRNDLIRLTDCENVLVEGVTIQNSPRFHLHPCYCRNIIVDGVTVRSEWNVQNGDGIDLSDCHQALIVGCTVSVGDDGICLKSGLPNEGRPVGCEDVLITRNTVNHAHGGFVLGSETAGGMRRIVATHCTFSGTDVGLRFKSAPGRGGKTEQLFVSDIQMNDISGEAIAFQCDYVDRHAGYDGKEPQFSAEQLRWAPQFRDIHISRVVCRGARTAIKAAGIAGMQCVSDIDLTDCTIIYNKVEKAVDPQTAQLTLNNVRLVKNHAE